MVKEMKESTIMQKRDLDQDNQLGMGFNLTEVPTSSNILTPEELNKLGLKADTDGVEHFEICDINLDFYKMESVSDFNLDQVRVQDYDIYFREIYDHMLQTGKIDSIPELALRPVKEYRDKLTSISTLDAHSILLYIPYLPLT